MSLRLVREFADEINDLVKSNSPSDEVIKSISSKISSLRGWLENTERQIEESGKPRDAQLARAQQIIDSLKKLPYSGSSRSVGYFAENGELLFVYTQDGLNGDTTQYVITVAEVNGKLRDSVVETKQLKQPFWDEIVSVKNPKRVIVNNHLYEIGKANTPSRHNGFGGDWHYIKYDTGELVKTCDLWARGHIPPAYRRRLKNNARFLNQDEFEATNEAES